MFWKEVLPPRGGAAPHRAKGLSPPGRGWHWLVNPSWDTEKTCLQRKFTDSLRLDGSRAPRLAPGHRLRPQGCEVRGGAGHTRNGPGPRRALRSTPGPAARLAFARRAGTTHPSELSPLISEPFPALATPAGPFPPPVQCFSPGVAGPHSTVLPRVLPRRRLSRVPGTRRDRGPRKGPAPPHRLALGLSSRRTQPGGHTDQADPARGQAGPTPEGSVAAGAGGLPAHGERSARRAGQAWTRAGRKLLLWGR